METVAALLLLCGGCYCTAQTRFIQFRRMKSALRGALDLRTSKNGVSPFSAMATSLAATIGTGNIAGVAGAILLGGPGTIFWMWMSALVGMASKYADIYFGIRFRTQDCIGPMAYMSRGLPKGFRWMGTAYAFCCMGACLCMGNLVQINALVEAGRTALTAFGVPGADAFWPGLVIGGGVAAIVAVVQFGGAKRVGRIASMLVPFMSVAYILGATAMIVFHARALPSACRAIVAHAFEPRAFLVGIARGTFTHEAGLGTAAIAHGCADTKTAHKQALYGVFEVFFDTLVICTLTALAILTSGVGWEMRGQAENSAYVIEAFGTVMGEKWAAACIAVSLALFAFSSILSFSYYGGVCAKYVFGTRGERGFRAVFPAFLVLGALLRVALVWRLAEWANQCMALLNMTALAMLLPHEKKNSPLHRLQG